MTDDDFWYSFTFTVRQFFDMDISSKDPGEATYKDAQWASPAFDRLQFHHDQL